MAEIDLLSKYPKAKRNIEARGQKSPEDVATARKFGREFFDGTRDQGYGGFRYDGRWVPVVRDFINYYGLNNNSSVLDVGCAKGFMLNDFLYWLPHMVVRGIDVSSYAIENAMPSIAGAVSVGDARNLSQFADKSYDLVISINTIHNLPLPECKEALREIERVKGKHSFITVDAYHHEEEKDRMMKWNLTAKTILSVDDWKKLFAEVGYTGDYYWFIP